MSRRDDPSREPVLLHITRRSAQLLLKVAFRVRITGAEHLPATGAVLLAGNHTGFLDGPVVMLVLPRPASILIKSEVYRGPLPAVLDFARQIPVHRGTPDRRALHEGLRVLAGGGVLGMFPEGTRGTGALDSVQPGIGYLALHARCPVVPVVCRGTERALPRGRIVPRLRAPIEVSFGPPFTVDVPGNPRARSTITAAAEQVRQGMRAHLEAFSAHSGAADSRRVA